MYNYTTLSSSYLILLLNSKDRDLFALKIAKIIGTNHSHVVTITKKLVEFGCVKLADKRGRTRPIKLTEKGKEIAEHLAALKTLNWV